jgi:hypothetical protein
LSLSSGGTISGSPISAGAFSFTAQVTDSSTPTAQTATSPLSISVSPSSVTTLESGNWSGYVATSGPYTSVTGTFDVPSLQDGTSIFADTSEWVGIDGFPTGNTSLIQAGVNENVDPEDPGEVVVQPWWEILPAFETNIDSVTVNAGDQVTVTISQVGTGEWSINLTDDNNGETFTTDQEYGGPGTSAEWIVEAPFVGDGVSPLAPYTPNISFDDLQAQGSVSALTEVVMVQGGSQVSTPSNYTSTGFAVAYGSTAPTGQATRGHITEPVNPLVAVPAPENLPMPQIRQGREISGAASSVQQLARTYLSGGCPLDR